MKTLRHALVFISALLGTSLLHAAPGDLDLGFGGGTGKVTTAIGASDDAGNSVIQQVDGKLVVAGYSSNGSNWDFALVRYNADGSLDTSFDGDGKVTTDFGASTDAGNSVIQQADGKLVVAGYSDNGGNYDFALVRYNADGSLDTGFDGDGKVTTDIGGSNDVGNSVIQQADGKLVVAGYSYNGSNWDFALARYNADGSLDTSFDGDGKVTTAIGASTDVGYSVIQQADGKLVVAGYSWNGSNDDVALVRYNTDGSLDTGFDGDGKVTTAIGTGYDEGYSVIQQADGKLVVAGTSYNGSSNDFALVRYNADGSLDASFDGDGKVTTAIGGSDDVGLSVIQQADGKLVVAGYSHNGSDSDVALVRYNADGSLDTGFDGDGKVTTAIGGSYDAGNSVIQQADGKLVVAGYSYNGNNYDVALVRYDSGQLITTTNLWLKKLATKVGAGSNDDRWSAQYLYNADRRSGQVFDPANDALNVALAGSSIYLPANTLVSKGKGFAYSTAKGVTPAIKVSLMPATQTLTVSMSGTEIGVALPATVANKVNLGSEQRKSAVVLDAKGKFLPTAAYESEAVVVTSATVKDSGTTKDSLVLKLNLADPALLSAYDFDTPCPPANKHCKQPEVAITLYDENGDVLLSKTLTSLLATTRTVSGITNIYSMKKIAADAAPDNILSAFSFASKKGALSLTLKNLVLNDALDSAQSQLGVAITIDGKIYFARVTLFETKSGSQTWSTKYSTYATPTP
jgi:uncharacterized delta-60 repeat protein